MATYKKRPLRRILFIPMLLAGVVYFMSKRSESANQAVSETSSSSRTLPQPPELELDLLEIINQVGTDPTHHLPNYAWTSSNLEVSGFLEELTARRIKFMQSSPTWRKQRKETRRSGTVHIATAACEERGSEEGVAMLKSALLFGQHTNIHAYVFTDPKSVTGLAVNLAELKWTSQALGNKFDFTVLHATFPKGWNGNAFAPCATQRLFLPSALPEVDAVLYVDADTLVLSDLRQIWGLFDFMNASALAAAAPNTEGPSGERIYMTPDIPIYGYRGINAGVMLMNLTRMRDFRMEERAIAVEFLYGNKLWLADQDIYNIIFRIAPDKLHLLDCTYNFSYTHCRGDDTCGSMRECFCDPILKTGLRILHGVTKSFHSNGMRSSGFMTQLYQTVRAADLLTMDALAVVEELAENFSTLDRPCSNLTADALYMNAMKYLQGEREKELGKIRQYASK